MTQNWSFCVTCLLKATYMFQNMYIHLNSKFECKRCKGVCVRLSPLTNQSKNNQHTQSILNPAWSSICTCSSWRWMSIYICKKYAWFAVMLYVHSMSNDWECSRGFSIWPLAAAASDDTSAIQNGGTLHMLSCFAGKKPVQLESRMKEMRRRKAIMKQ